MSHEIESAFIAGDTAGWWDRQKEFWQQELMTPLEAWNKGPIKWGVDLVPVEFMGQETGYHLLVRDIDDKVLSCVGKDFVPVQNWELMEIMMAVTNAGHGLGVESVLSLKEGKVVAIGARRPEAVKIAGETHLQHFTVANWHGQGRKAVLYASDIRTECANTLRFGMSRAKNVFKFSHTGNMEAKIAEAKEHLELGFEYQDRLVEVGNALALQPMSKRNFEEFLKKAVPVRSDDDQQTITRVMNTREGIKRVYQDEPDLQNITGTPWGALQASAQYWDHEINYRSPDNRFVASLTQDNGMQRAFDVISKMYQVS